MVQIARPSEVSQAGHGVFTFSAGPLPTAGSYTVVAEWAEHRMGVPLTNARSPATSITVAAGPPTDARVRHREDPVATWSPLTQQQRSLLLESMARHTPTAEPQIQVSRGRCNCRWAAVWNPKRAHACVVTRR